MGLQMTYGAFINISSWQMPCEAGGEYKLREENALEGHRLSVRDKLLSGVHLTLPP